MAAKSAKKPTDKKPADKKPAEMKKLNLALQGGGSHGAFTWGVLDRLLEEEDIEVEGVTATSAGAMNGAMLTTGMKIGGRQEARARLERFWREIVEINPLNQAPWSFWLGAWPAMPAAAMGGRMGEVMGEMMGHIVSPYQFNPANINPLRAALESIVDFSKVRRLDHPRLFVCATDVWRGRARIFTGHEITLDALLASACLPTLFQAVEIDGRPYWDGGFTGNPPIWPLIYNCACADVLIVHINPLEREETPHSARAIENRVNEISFNSNLMGEMRAIAMVNRLLREGALEPGRYKRMHIHAVEDAETMNRLSSSTKLTPDWRLISGLRDAGRAAMGRWLEANKHKIGVESSVDIRAKYL